MSNTTTFSITLPQDLANLVKAKVASGQYQSDSAVIAESLRTTADHDRAYEKWLIDEVMPTEKAYDADPSRGTSIEEARRRFHAYADAQEDKIPAAK